MRSIRFVAAACLAIVVLFSAGSVNAKPVGPRHGSGNQSSPPAPVPAPTPGFDFWGWVWNTSQAMDAFWGWANTFEFSQLPKSYGVLGGYPEATLGYGNSVMTQGPYMAQNPNLMDAFFRGWNDGHNGWLYSGQYGLPTFRPVWGPYYTPADGWAYNQGYQSGWHNTSTQRWQWSREGSSANPPPMDDLPPAPGDITEESPGFHFPEE